MRNPDILKQTNFQSRIIPIDFAGYPERIMLAGCPVNAKGQFANDGSAIGILVEDVRRKYAYGEIAVAGFVDYEIAQNHAGIEYTKECMTALKNIVFEGVGDKWIEAGGVSSWNDLTDRPFNRQTVDITWDGNTDGLLSLGPLYRVSELPYAPFKFLPKMVQATCVYKSRTYTAYFGVNGDNSLGMYDISGDPFGTGSHYQIGVILEKPFESEGVLYEPGIYLFNKENGLFCSHLSYEAIQNIDSKVLPYAAHQLVIVEFMDTVTFSMSYEEVAAAVAQHEPILCKYLLIHNDYSNGVSYYNAPLAVELSYEYGAEEFVFRVFNLEGLQTKTFFLRAEGIGDEA